METLGELERVLGREKFEVYLGRDERMGFVALMRRHSHVFEVDEAEFARLKPACRDPDDDKFLALAQAAEAGVLVSSDDDLLTLHPWYEVAIVTPLEFLSRATDR